MKLASEGQNTDRCDRAYVIDARMPAEKAGALDPLEFAHFHGWATSSGREGCRRFVRAETNMSAELFAVGASVIVTETGMQRLSPVMDPAYFVPCQCVGVLVLPPIGSIGYEWANDGYGVSQLLINQALERPPQKEHDYYKLELPVANAMLSKVERERCIVDLERDVVAGNPGYGVAVSAKILSELDAYKDMGIVVKAPILRVMQDLVGIQYFYTAEVRPR